MDTYIQKLRTYVQEHKIIFEDDCPQPCLDELWWHYGEHHDLESKDSREGLRAIQTHLAALHFEDSDAVLTEIGSLCAEYERIAFSHGLRLGVQLMLEIQSL